VQPSLDLARIAADLETRAGRLQRFVQGLASVLERFEANARSDDPSDLLADFEAPEASHEALRVLTEASTATRHDLAVLRTDIHALMRASPDGARPAIVGRIHEAGLAAAALVARFVAFQRDTGERLAARGAGPSGASGPAAQALQRFVANAERTLQDVADGALRVDQEDGHLGLMANATPTNTAVRTVIIPPLPRNGERRRPGALPALAAAGGAFTSWGSRLARANSTLGTLAAGGALATVVLVVVVVSSGTPSASGSPPSSAEASAGASQGGSGGVAVGSGSPGASSDASPGTSEPAVSLLPGQTPPPGSSPAPSSPGQSQPPASASPGPSTAPTPTPPGVTPPPPTPVPTPAPTLDPGAAADAFAARVTSAANSIDAMLTSINASSQAADFAAAKATAQNLETLAAAERAWLQAHPPATCYETPHTNALARYADLIATAVEIQADADAQNTNAISNDVASGHVDVAALKQAATKAAHDCP